MRVVHSSPSSISPTSGPSLRIVVEDIVDPALVAAAQDVAERCFREHGIAGQWTMAIAASDVRGRWDVAVRGPHGRHFFSFPASPDQLPELVSHHLDRLLDRLAS